MITPRTLFVIARSLQKISVFDLLIASVALAEDHTLVKTYAPRTLNFDLAYLQIDLRGKAIAIVIFVKVNDRTFRHDASRIDLRHTHIIATLDVI